MNIVFFGTSEFAVPSLNELIGSGHTVSAVYTQPDRKKGRSLRLTKSPVKVAALDKGIKILQPEKIDTTCANELKGFAADLFIVIAYGHILPKEILDIPKKYSMNLHASLLPKYRGAAPINWAVVNGENVTGVTSIRMNEELDAGDIILASKTEITANEDSKVLSDRLSFMGASLLLDSLDLAVNNQEVFTPQNTSKVTYARKLTKDDGLIDWNDNAFNIHNKIRGMIPWPGAYSFLDGKKVKILKTDVILGEKGKAGTIVKADEEGFFVNTGDNIIKILKIQPESGKPMDAASFLRGHRVKVYTTFSG